MSELEGHFGAPSRVKIYFTDKEHILFKTKQTKTYPQKLSVCDRLYFHLTPQVALELGWTFETVLTNRTKVTLVDPEAGVNQ